jgi:hypothetical protein
VRVPPASQPLPVSTWNSLGTPCNDPRHRSCAPSGGAPAGSGFGSACSTSGGGWSQSPPPCTPGQAVGPTARAGRS